MYLKLNGIEMNCEGNERWVELLPRLPDGGAGALGVSVRGRTESLNDPVKEYAFANTLTYADEEGRRIPSLPPKKAQKTDRTRVLGTKNQNKI